MRVAPVQPTNQKRRFEMVPGQREQLYRVGVARLQQFCRTNNLDIPRVERIPRADWRFDSCAYYRPVYIAICVEQCAQKGFGGRQWSWPGYVVDRTPFGVLQHELGHHVDIVLSGMKHGYQGSFSQLMRFSCNEEPITSYCPNDAEWFAEIFRLFVTNPDLLRLLRPKAYGELSKKFDPVVSKDWKAVLKGAEERYFNAAQRKIDRYYDGGSLF